MKLFQGLLTLFFITGCSLFTLPRDGKTTAAPAVKDVPYNARGGTDDLRKKVLVLPFIDSDLNRGSKVADAARKAVVDDLIETKSFVVVSNSDIPQDLKSFVKENAEYDLVAVSRLATNMGISAVIEGKIVEIRARRKGDEIGVFRKLRAQVDTTIQIRVFGAKAGREIFNTSRTSTVESESTRVGENSFSDRQLPEDPGLVRAGVQKAFRESIVGIVKAVDKLSWEGRVAMVTGEKIYINAGRLSGIQVGDILKITEEADEIFDPESGSFIGEAPGRIKGTVEVVSYFGKDGAISIVHSGSGFKENDKVELY